VENLGEKLVGPRPGGKKTPGTPFVEEQRRGRRKEKPKNRCTTGGGDFEKNNKTNKQEAKIKTKGRGCPNGI